jgi:hypothetical protein
MVFAHPLQGAHDKHVVGPLAAPLEIAQQITSPSTGILSGSRTATMVKRVAAVVLSFPGQKDDFTPADVRTLYFGTRDSVASYYQEVSYGQLSISGQVFGPVKIEEPFKGCPTDSWRDAATQALSERGIDLSGFDVVALIIPINGDCGWGGMDEGRWNWINGFLATAISAHELGHALGEMHASSYRCIDGEGQPVTLAPYAQCKSDEYGDPFDVMAAENTRGMSAVHRYQLGFLSDAQIVTSSGSYTLYPVEGSDSPRLLRIQRPDGQFFDLDMRTISGRYDDFSPASPAVRGVTIRLDGATHWTNTELLDATPETDTFADAPFMPGMSLTDPEDNIRVAVSRVIPGKEATVQVEIGQTATSEAAPLAAPDQVTAQKDGSAVVVSWQAPTGSQGVAGYQVYRDGSYVDSVTRLAKAIPGTSHWDRSRYQVRAYDADGNLSSFASAQIVKPAEAKTPKPLLKSKAKSRYRSIKTR